MPSRSNPAAVRTPGRRTALARLGALGIVAAGALAVPAPPAAAAVMTTVYAAPAGSTIAG